MPERRGAADAAALAAALAGPCACARQLGRSGDPGPLVAAGEMIREARRVHLDPQCTEHVVVCAACGARYWVVEDNGHWQRASFTWSTRPLLL